MSSPLLLLPCWLEIRQLPHAILSDRYCHLEAQLAFTGGTEAQRSKTKLSELTKLRLEILSTFSAAPSGLPHGTHLLDHVLFQAYKHYHSEAVEDATRTSSRQCRLLWRVRV